MKERFYRFMQGRYGVDQLNRFLMVLVLICLFLSILGGRPFYIIGIALLIYSYFRIFSKNLYKRSSENAVYLKYEYRFRQKLASWKRNMRQLKTHHIYKCPSCRQKIRVPRGKGRIEIRCPKCNQTFIKKS